MADQDNFEEDLFADLYVEFAAAHAQASLIHRVMAATKLTCPQLRR
jgi:hypothetical protein